MELLDKGLLPIAGEVLRYKALQKQRKDDLVDLTLYTKLKWYLESYIGE